MTILQESLLPVNNIVVKYNESYNEKLQYLLRLDTVVLFRCHNFQSTKVVQHPNIGDVEFGKEPIMILGPTFHFRVAAE